MGRGKVAIDLTGQKFNMLTIIKRVKHGRHKTKQAVWKCRCDCGKISLVTSYEIRKGKTKSCGCYGRALLGKASITHGKTETPEYAIWTDIFQRCYNTKRPAYKNYGGRGIKVCKRWSDFQNFLDDMGVRPCSFLTLERLNNNKGYCKTNCKWATRKEQSLNRRVTRFVTYKGETLCITDWETKLGFEHWTLYQRLFKYNWPLDKAFTTPVKSSRKRLTSSNKIV